MTLKDTVINDELKYFKNLCSQQLDKIPDLSGVKQPIMRPYYQTVITLLRRNITTLKSHGIRCLLNGHLHHIRPMTKEQGFRLPSLKIHIGHDSQVTVPLSLKSTYLRGRKRQGYPGLLKFLEDQLEYLKTVMAS